MRLRAIPIVISLLAATCAAVTIGAGPASASVSCGSKTRHLSIRDGGVSLRVGWVELTVEVCTDGNSITSSSAAVDGNTTGPGDASGFDLHFGSAGRDYFDGGGFNGGAVGYTTNDSLRDCVPYVLTFCSNSENYYVHSRVDMLNGLNVRATDSSEMVIHGRVFKWGWWWACTNSACGVRLS
jgi:hypothetical protein